VQIVADMKKIILIWILTTFVISTACTNKQKFDKSKWEFSDELGFYPNRDEMLNDLTQNEKLKGLTYRQLIDKIGEPEKNIVEESNSIYYSIVTNYGHDIDPVYSKTLEFRFNKDSVVVDFRIIETKH
jgi:hypothetical protein